ncbi:hypothetical protein [Lacimicrobium sp. SS2-24]|uniref:hypothetical protein n=1 Tax=Lacimicrobium sp. SS2-24 TaxID=2005569 RepID=UPI001130A896|nr:hypothetical protein [Lacimicrobium sp. SS2-24]
MRRPTGLPLGCAWLCLCLMGFSYSVHSQDAFRVEGEKRFTVQKQQQLIQWLEHGVSETAKVLGDYPFTVYFHLYPRTAGQPVPWANTWRAGKQSVHLYVDVRFSLAQFIDDWTLYHELSHLALPYLGSQQAWFAEGFASFMQYQIMSRAGLLAVSPEQRYRDKVHDHMRWFNSDHSVAAIARQLLSQGHYASAYWGSAWFFVLAEQQLAAQQRPSVVELVARYQVCCRLQDERIEEVLASFDRLSKSRIFTDLYEQFTQEKAREVLYQPYANKG